MPRAGSPDFPSGGPPGGTAGGAAPPAPVSIGEVAAPPFAVLPDPAGLFARRALRFATLAEGHELAPYLRFLGALAGAQHAAQAALPEPVLPPPAAIEQAYEHSMPPVSVGQVSLDAVFDATLAAFLDGLAGVDMPEPSRRAVAGLRLTAPDSVRAMAETVLLGAMPGDAIAGHVLLAAALQVHFARLAARLEARRLTRVADAACPACGSSPGVSMVVGWPGAAGSRFCVCAVCATAWHVVRIKCLLCGADGQIAYHGIEGGRDTVKGETCEDCHGYVKILHQHKEPAVDPVADDVATLGLDLLLRDAGYARGGANPFLIGY